MGVLIRSDPKPNAAFPLPIDATDKIWLKLANWSWRYFCSKVWMTTTDDDGRRRTTTDDGALLYYKLALWAFGSGELKMNDMFREGLLQEHFCKMYVRISAVTQQ